MRSWLNDKIMSSNRMIPTDDCALRRSKRNKERNNEENIKAGVTNTVVLNDEPMLVINLRSFSRRA